MRDWFIQTAKPMLRELSAKAYNYPEEAGEEQWREILLEMADLLEIMDVWDDTAARKSAGVAEDDNSIIVRLYDAYNQKTNATITAGFDFKEAYICDLMENKLTKLDVSDSRKVSCDVSNFEIVTIMVNR